MSPPHTGAHSPACCPHPLTGQVALIPGPLGGPCPGLGDPCQPVDSEAGAHVESSPTPLFSEVRSLRQAGGRPSPRSQGQGRLGRQSTGPGAHHPKPDPQARPLCAVLGIKEIYFTMKPECCGPSDRLLSPINCLVFPPTPPLEPPTCHLFPDLPPTPCGASWHLSRAFRKLKSTPFTRRRH